MLIFSPEIPMSLEEFRLLRDFVYQYCGLHFSEDSRYILEKRLGRRLQHLRLNNYKDYYYYLRYNAARDQELTELINLLTTNETYFFREEFQLRSFSEEIVPEICRRKQEKGERRIRIWSAGCSTGEEPYTIAMLLLENRAVQGWQIEIIGTDISQRVLQVARKGLYGESSFRSTPERYRQRHFRPQDGKWLIDDSVKRLVTISHLNLFDRPRVALLGRMDIIFCRNVIIYFDLPAKKRVVETFYQRLNPGGYLLLGHSESLMNITTLYELKHLQHDMVYQKPLDDLPGGLKP
ncbi:CheR-type MCP methyltransferase [Geothermobacter ehrlichii]|uniref:protein-glutamate O-methyltransferase n=1 Tax=Geothermobacter ehrlichii TaxID=213224 RepID=A0A5D3WLU9_9BACT|nr:protein-glutamate O-methyltransferase CheR [Geothermobacter ehrlichii]TYP00136.1 CheR-type MCP methyltransferase [Geothermobacter ehrlichii]